MMELLFIIIITLIIVIFIIITLIIIITIIIIALIIITLIIITLIIITLIITTFVSDSSVNVGYVKSKPLQMAISTCSAILTKYGTLCAKTPVVYKLLFSL
jgi:hypothetical protein